MEALGAQFTDCGDGVWQVTGVEPDTEYALIDCGESGSTLRFMIPIAACLADKAKFIGEGRLPTRPIQTILDVFDQAKASYTYAGALPLITEERFVMPKAFALDGSISSQFFTGFLMAAPITGGELKLGIEGKLESEPYVELTREVMAAFGAKVDRTETGYHVPAGQAYRSVDYHVEGDFSQAAFWIVAGLIGDQPLRLRGLKRDSTQGDRAVLALTAEMGGRWEWDGEDLVVYPSETKGIEIDVRDIPDLVPILSVLAAVSQGETRIVNAARLRIKESDRLKSTTDVLTKLGADVTEEAEGLLVVGGSGFTGASVDAWNDHRIAMAVAIAATRSTGNIELTGSHAVKKSYPHFWEEYQRMGGIADV
jgi:3-phosphoshikimate 1-carboxyvinyltransferase